jgi:hypothetical protein
MHFQYISDQNGVTAGVYIPIEEWNLLKKRYVEIEHEEISDIPQWHNDIVSERLSNYQSGKDPKVDFDKAIDDIEKDL